MTREELEAKVENGELVKLHTSWKRGYVSRKSSGYVSPYKGRFGEGYILETPSWRSSEYCYVTYFVKKK